MSILIENEIESVYKLFSQVYPISQKDFQAFSGFLKRKSFKKGERILDLGQVDTKISFVLSGIVHVFGLIDGEVFTINIALPGMLYNSLSSYTESKPCSEVQDAVTDVEILYLEKSDTEKLLRSNHAFCYIYAKLYEHVLMEREQRTLLLQYKSSYKRFEHFMSSISNAQRYLAEVPQKLVSQYLGLAPETFSRVKGQFLRQS